MDFHLLQGESRFKPSGRFPAEPVWQEYSSADSRAANRSDNVAAQWNILFLTARVTVHTKLSYVCIFMSENRETRLRATLLLSLGFCAVLARLDICCS